MAMKMVGLGWEYWYDSFNVFDTIVNLTSLAMFLLEIFSSSGSISSLSALRAVRILRVLKLMKRAESLQVSVHFSAPRFLRHLFMREKGVCGRLISSARMLAPYVVVESPSCERTSAVD